MVSIGERAEVPTVGALRIAAAWGVHLFTASGTVVAFLAWRGIAAGRFGDAFRWLVVAMFIDCVDGTMARAVEVKRVLPWFDGTKLDDIIDYLTYVVLPIVLLYEARLLPDGNGGPLQELIPTGCSISACKPSAWVG